ncbi:MAG: hypothetical protein JSW55_13280 [Chloroflexota bacterium]|nr:MAG: hypothetical protein JSW55_13280 [Chloroflexota bacterium]
MASEGRPMINWRGIAITGLAYGGGLMAGNIVAQILFSLISPLPYGWLGEAARLLIGILVVMIVTGSGAAIGGFLGGWTLPVIGKPMGKYGYAWRSALSVGLVYGTFLVVAVFAISSLTVRDAALLPVSPFMQVYMLVGLITGALIGLLLGLTTVGWRLTGSLVLAGMAGFGLGGAALGAAIWAYLNTAPPGAIYDGQYAYLMIGLFIFGLFGGLAIGLAYDRLARRASDHAPKPPRRWIRYAAYALVGLIALWLAMQLRPFFAFLQDYLTPRWALDTETIAADSVGTHWQVSSPFQDEIAEVEALDLSVGKPGALALASIERTDASADVALRIAQFEGDGAAAWGPPVSVSDSPSELHAISVAADATGDIHVAWLEGDDGVAYYSRCSNVDCMVPRPLTDAAVSCSSGSEGPDALTIDVAASPDGTVMAVWSDPQGGLAYRTLPDGEPDCVPLPGDAATGTFSLASRPASGFSLTLADRQNAVWLMEYANDGWGSAAVEIGAGVRPDLLVTEYGSALVVWCAEGGGVELWNDGQTELLSQLSCKNKPAIALDGDGRYHVVWRSDQVEDVLGEVKQDEVLYETIGDGESWSEPMIVARLEESSDYGMVSDPTGELHLAWNDLDPAIHYARQRAYECDPGVLAGAEAGLYQVASQGGYRPQDDVIPFCQNKYEEMFFTPTVDPAFSEKEPTLNGGYDDYAELVLQADHEVLFTTMAYSKAVNQDSPGAVQAQAVVDLYEKVKANPENYPRGMTVRLLLGNSPTINFELLESDGGLWYILEDLQAAGLEKMVDPELGWRVEVGNYSGRYPYSHVKTMIIDGETVVASGFNHEYKPLPQDHPSGLGKGDTDTALVITGPVAQHSRQIYDRLWTGAIQRYCPDLSLSETELRLTCEDSRGVPDHAPEVMRYSQADDDAVAFSMFRSHVYDEADQQILAAFHSAEESIDVAQAMFSAELICNLNHFFDVCDFGQALPYMEALMDAAERGVKIRILLTPYPTQNIENIIAMEIFNHELAERGLGRNVEIRMYDHLLHSKSALIDGEFVIVGSQNLHWSAFGEENGLNEYNLGVGDQAAADQYRRFFDYMWERAPSRIETAA